MLVGDFRNYNHFIIFSFLLMNNISITIKMHVESWVGVVKLDVQCDHCFVLPLFLIASAIGRLNCWWFFFSVYPMYLTLLPKDLRCVHIALSSCRVSFSWCPKLHNQVDWGHRNKETSLLSDIVRDVFIEIIGNRICCVATSLIFLNSELFSTR